MTEEKDFCNSCKRKLEPEWIICPFCGKSETDQYFQLQKAYKEDWINFRIERSSPI